MSIVYLTLSGQKVCCAHGLPLTAVYTLWCGPVDTAEADVLSL